MPLSGNKLKVNQIRGAGSGAQPISISGGDGSHTGSAAPFFQTGYTAIAADSSQTLTGPQHCGTVALLAGSTGHVTVTVMTGALLDAYYDGDLPIGASWDLIVDNQTAATYNFTLTAASGFTVQGTAAVAATVCGVFKITKTAAAEFVAIRLDA